MKLPALGTITGAILGITALVPSAQAMTVDELQIQVNELSDQIKAMNGDKTVNIPFDVDVSGSVNLGILQVEDGRKDKSNDNHRNFWIVSNDNAPNRLRVEATKSYNEDFKVGTTFEFGFTPNGTSSINQDTTGVQNLSTITTRILEAYFNTYYGKFAIGQGHTASDGITEYDYSETWVFNYSGVSDICGGLNYRMESSRNLGTTTLGTYFSNMSGLGRKTRVGYESPSWKNLSFGTSAIDDGDWDLALYYDNNHDLENFKVSGGVAYADNRQNNGYRSLSGSVSAIHTPTMINLSIAGGTRNLTSNYTDSSGVVYASGRKNPHFFYSKLGWIYDYFKCGNTAISADFYRSRDFTADSDKNTSCSMGIVQHVPKVNLQAYLGARRYKTTDESDNHYEPIWAYMAGVRVAF
ncbi:MAG: hypothetical protein ACQEP8_03930 [Chlamydiota bacterium]